MFLVGLTVSIVTKASYKVGRSDSIAVSHHLVRTTDCSACLRVDSVSVYMCVAEIISSPLIG